MMNQTILELRDVASEEDLRFLMELRSQNLEFYFDQTPIDWEMQLRWWQKAKADSDNRYLVAWYCGQRVGMGRLHRVKSDPIGMGGDIEKGFQGRGLGRELFETLIALCQRKYTAEKIWLEVLPSNHRAIGLYVSLGFEEVERAKNKIRMELTIKHDDQLQ